jgi:hypothetical protein
MAVDIGEIHNVVRTYRLALRDLKGPEREPPASPALSQNDRVSLSDEARARVDQPAARTTKG